MWISPLSFHTCCVHIYCDLPIEDNIIYFISVQIQNLEAENYTLQENLTTANNTIEEHKQKEKDFEENVNGLTHKVTMLEKAEEDYQVSQGGK